MRLLLSALALVGVSASAESPILVPQWATMESFCAAHGCVYMSVEDSEKLAFQIKQLRQRAEKCEPSI